MSRLPFSRGRARHAPASIELDFVPIRRAPSPLGWALLAVGLLCAVGEVRRLLEARSDLVERAAIVDALRRQRLEAPRVPDAAPLSVQEVLGAQHVAARLEADWSDVFAALARVRGADVAWVEVDLLKARGRDAPAAEGREPEARRGEWSTSDANGGTARRGLRLGGEARSLDAVLQLLARMRTEPTLAAAELLGHEATMRNGVAFVRFVVATRNPGVG